LLLDLDSRIFFASRLFAAYKGSRYPPRSPEGHVFRALKKHRAKNPGRDWPLVCSGRFYLPEMQPDPEVKLVLASTLVDELVRVKGHHQASASWALHRLVSRGCLGTGLAWELTIPEQASRFTGCSPFGWEKPTINPLPANPHERPPYRSMVVWSLPGLWEWWRNGTEVVVGSGKGDSLPSKDPSAEDQYVFRHVNDFWQCQFRQEKGFIKDNAGMGYIARLLANPHRSIPAMTVMGCVGGSQQVQHTYQQAIDSDTRRRYQKRMEDLKDEINDAKERGNDGEVETLQKEFYGIADELQGTHGLRNKPRPLGPPTNDQRARSTVRKGLGRAYQRMRKNSLTALADHLDDAIQTDGTSYAYRPPPPLPGPPWQL